jgi:hypothetical protein
MTGKATNKDSLTSTLICGSNAAGEALPPHFQFQTKATSGDRERIRSEVFAFTPRVIGQFGTDSERAWDCTFGLNTKGGMDDREFELYIINSILPLYPNTLDRPGKRLILKCDSIPKEKMNKPQMVAKWKEIRLIHVPPPIFEKWGDSDEEELIRLKSTEVDISETALGRYAALMKRQAFASVLDFTDDEWTNLKMLREATSAAVATTAEATTDETQMDARAGEGQYNDLG